MSRIKDPNFVKVPRIHEELINALIQGQRVPIKDFGAAIACRDINRQNRLIEVEKTARINQSAEIVHRTPKYLLVKIHKQE